MNLQNGQTFLLQEIEWLEKIIRSRLHNYFNKENELADILSIQPVEPGNFVSNYSEFIIKNHLNFEERLVLIMALAPHVRPDFFDNIFNQELNGQGEFPQIGGIRGKSFRGFLPTVETALFVLAGNDLELRFKTQFLFDTEHFFYKNQVINLSDSTDHEPVTSARLLLEQEYIEMFTVGKISRPRFSSSFPAQYLSTELSWDDLVLNSNTLAQIKEIENWINYNNLLLHDWGMKAKLKPGFRCMFHGQSGTGKTLTATLLGKYTGRDVFRIDLSTVISKYIGETEKNLSLLFDKAQNKEWILFFDEADALFGKRTNVRDAHDKYANQEVSYLLQRIENHSGLVILASNFKSNIDEAFTRRFQSLIYFPMPSKDERLLLWQKSLPKNVELDKNVNLEAISRNYELSGANIINVVQFISLQALSENTNKFTSDDIVNGIRKEYAKEGKLFQ